MSDRDVPPLPPELRAAIDAERGGASGADAARDGVRSRLHATLALAPIGGASGGGGAGGAGAAGGGSAGGGAADAGATMSAGKLATIVTSAVLAIGGASAYVMLDHGAERTTAATTVERVLQPNARSAPAIIPSPRLDPDPVELAPEPVTESPRPKQPEKRRPHEPQAVSAAVPAPTRAISPPTPIVARPEASILADASRALSSGDATTTLVFVDEHARAYVEGELAEERDALRIRALAALGRMSEARTYAAAFHQHFSRSAHRGVVDAALDQAKESP